MKEASKYEQQDESQEVFSTSKLTRDWTEFLETVGVEFQRRAVSFGALFF